MLLANISASVTTTPQSVEGCCTWRPPPNPRLYMRALILEFLSGINLLKQSILAIALLFLMIYIASIYLTQVTLTRVLDGGLSDRSRCFRFGRQVVASSPSH